MLRRLSSTASGVYFVLMATSCPFCSYAVGRFTRELIVYEDEDVLVVPCKGQKRNNRGHCLVVTRAHIPNIYELPHTLSASILRAVSAAARASKKAFSADGVSLRQNNDAASGQAVFHLHFHIVPRFSEMNSTPLHMKTWMNAYAFSRPRHCDVPGYLEVLPNRWVHVTDSFRKSWAFVSVA